MFSPGLPIDEVAPERIELQPRALGSAHVSCRLRCGQTRLAGLSQQGTCKVRLPKSTVHGYFDLWAWDGTLERMHEALYLALREKEGREASPSVAIIDSQSAKSAQKGGGLGRSGRL
jgi:hypothetical protein